MNSFLIGLQFLTRISLVKQEVWTEEAFGRSVRWFPLIGAVLGCIYAFAAYICCTWLPEQGISPPPHLTAAFLLLLPVLMTGGIHYDGFMDTMDGIFSGRSRERMLEIMKDSCTGSYAVVTMTGLMLLEYSMLLDIPAAYLPAALFTMPVLGRLMMVLVIRSFPYARPEGMGKAFSEYTGTGTLLFAGLSGGLLLIPVAWTVGMGCILAAFSAVLVFSLYFGAYTTRLLGGVTGDVYGAAELLSEALVLMIFLLMLM